MGEVPRIKTDLAHKTGRHPEQHKNENDLYKQGRSLYYHVPGSGLFAVAAGEEDGAGAGFGDQVEEGMVGVEVD